MQFSLSFWIGFFIFVAIALAIDIGAFNRTPKTLNFKQASNMTAIWVLLASIFCTGIYYIGNEQKALEFLTAYIVEFSLSMDNVFVFIMIFSYFKIPSQYQHRVLFWGIVGAIVMRFVMILGGVYMVEYFEWLFVVFGVFLIIVGLKMAFVKDNGEQTNLYDNIVIKFIKQRFKVTDELADSKFVVIKNGDRHFTPLFLVLVLIEKTDLIFALDSIPAVLAISKDPFIVFTSNIFAILGLRSLYFLLAGLMHKFSHLKYGICTILVFVGMKMILVELGYKIPIGYSLSFILLALAISICSSLFFNRSQNIAKS